ncbi:GntR family transcriptional regulator [Mycolicibacterium diernhoferi]|uniref:GntR family transcriptional regulator n=1 Tax=Mycolicibacterium diernhoferi TaxID=1801 RepID=A0A1Q4H4A1_9MYCO|nr:GntR family transcriptional regulator [Mycolicibacterium diernhoferi]OJZ61599.1 GntR family transcriptional regulator [Mycolicibacterium diernhoferi]OPE44807.1 GntR family transcriptional regulator [Mycolicibacterium diernhoferi]PEG51414.1 GntR family transcriptional regulator [Mycolicibacterium diernhoferi]QYL23444.1 GntR family transcriptional regulator [Mycolicibacterium diernhoferi]
MEESPGGPVAEDVRRRILSMLASGALRPGSRLGTEREMADSFAVSRSTLRSALLPLSQAGVLERRTGRAGGTFIRADVVQRNAAEQSGLPARLHSTGHTSATTVLAADHRPATPAEAAALEVPDGTPIFAIRRLRYADGVPLSVDLSCFVAARTADLLEQPLDGSIYELLRERYGLQPDYTTETIEVVSASPREADWLQIAQRQPLLAITRVTRDSAGRPYEHAYDLFRADRVRLTATSSGAGVSPVSAAVVPDRT